MPAVSRCSDISRQFLKSQGPTQLKIFLISAMQNLVLGTKVPGLTIHCKERLTTPDRFILKLPLPTYNSLRAPDAQG